MININPARTLQILQHLEDTVGVSVTLTITMATMTLRLGDLAHYTQLIGRHAEARGSTDYFGAFLFILDLHCACVCVCVYTYDPCFQMVLVYGFIEEPRLLVHGGGGGQPTRVRPSALTQQLMTSLPGLLVAAMVGLHENNKITLEQADHVFKVCDPPPLLADPAPPTLIYDNSCIVRVICAKCVCLCLGAGL